MAGKTVVITGATSGIGEVAADRLAGKGERIVFIRTLITGKQGTEPGRSIDTVSNTGQYL